MRTLHILILVGLTTALAPGVSAQSQQHKHKTESGDPGQLGEVHFPISCNAAAQQEFNRAMAMLHSFWYQESEKAFSVVAQKDSDCAMTYWGIAMSRFHQLWEKPSPEDLNVGQTALEKARTLGAGARLHKGSRAALPGC